MLNWSSLKNKLQNLHVLFALPGRAARRTNDRMCVMANIDRLRGFIALAALVARDDFLPEDYARPPLALVSASMSAALSHACSRYRPE